MKTYNHLREYRYHKAVERFCALALLALIVTACLVYHG